MDNISLTTLYKDIINDATFQNDDPNTTREDAAWEAAWQRYRQHKNNDKALSLPVQKILPSPPRPGLHWDATKHRWIRDIKMEAPISVDIWAKATAIARGLGYEDFSAGSKGAQIRNAIALRQHPYENKLDDLNIQHNIEKSKYAVNPFAVATNAAKQMGYESFKEGTAGKEKRDEIAESIKQEQKSDSTDNEFDEFLKDNYDMGLNKSNQPENYYQQFMNFITNYYRPV